MRSLFGGEIGGYTIRRALSQPISPARRIVYPPFET